MVTHRDVLVARQDLDSALANLAGLEPLITNRHAAAVFTAIRNQVRAALRRLGGPPDDPGTGGPVAAPAAAPSPSPAPREEGGHA